MSDHHKPWEPDPAKLGNWQAMFEQRRNGAVPPLAPPAASAADHEFDDADMPTPDGHQYKPWTLQRVRSRPPMMLALRRIEKSGLWRGWIMAYPSLQAIEYLGDRMVNLDFGSRQFLLEGHGLEDLVNHLQQGSVAAVQEYAEGCWAERPDGPIISAIRNLSDGMPQR